MPIDMSASGCEWWVNVTKSELLASAACGDIGFHFDKDEHAFQNYGLVIHPLLSTVTYLSNDGAPTVILPSLGLSAAAGGNYHSAAESSTAPQEAVFVPPRVGRHVRFDGRWLHGAPAALRPVLNSGSDHYERMTFCVNIWVNHRPGRAKRYDSDGPFSCQQDKSPRLRLSSARSVPQSREAVWRRMRPDDLEPSLCFPLEQTEVAHELRLPTSGSVASLLRNGDVVALQGVQVTKAGSSEVVVGKMPQDFSRKRPRREGAGGSRP
jgi:hypothetical protein